MASRIEVTIKNTGPTTMAFLLKKGPYTQIPEAFEKLYRWIGEMGYIPAGPPSGLYMNIPGQVADAELTWELRSPLSGNIQSSSPDEEGLGVKDVGTALVASAMHRGPYNEIGKTHQAITEWVAQNGYIVAGPLEEVYFSSPETPPEDILTEIHVPIEKQ